MKRQFVHIPLIKGQGYSEQAATPGEWTPVTTQGDAAPASEVLPSSGQLRPQTGLLSGWKASNSDLSLSGFDKPVQELPDSQSLAPLEVQPFPKPPIWPSMSGDYQSGPPPTIQQDGFYSAPPSPIAQAPAPAGKKKPAHQKKRFPIWVRIVVLALLVLLVLTGVGVEYYQVNFADHINNIVGQKAANVAVNRGEDGGNANQASTINGPTLSGRRINILLLGSDNDTKFSAPLAQTDIVVTIDPTTKYVGMLSIPRDLWVNTPNFSAHKLDEAFGLGWSSLHQGPTPFSNAVGESIATIEQDFGIHIDYYAWVGLSGFIKVIDTAGGVDIDAIHPMTDDNYPDDINTADPYAFKRLYIPPGPQHMNGLLALEYVRTRHSDLVGDFGRSARQQQVLSQLKIKLATPGIVSKLPELIKDLDGYVKTDMDLSTIINLMGFARSIDPNKVDRLVLSQPYSTGFVTANGQDALRPNCALIIPKIAKMFDLTDKALCSVQADSSTSPTLASSAVSSTSTTLTLSSAAIVSPNLWQRPDQTGRVSAMSLKQGNDDMLGVHSLIDLLLLVVCTSFDAVKV